MLRVYPLSGIAEGYRDFSAEQPRHQAALGRRTCIAEQLNPGFLLGLRRHGELLDCFRLDRRPCGRP
jgi:hypothetical protein